MSQNVFSPPLGTHGNAWNASTVAANGVSSVVDTYSNPHVSAFGNVSAATTVTLQYSADGINFYAGGNVVVAGAGNFHIDATLGARYLRLSSSAAATITASIQAKG